MPPRRDPVEVGSTSPCSATRSAQTGSAPAICCSSNCGTSVGPSGSAPRCAGLGRLERVGDADETGGDGDHGKGLCGLISPRLELAGDLGRLRHKVRTDCAVRCRHVETVRKHHPAQVSALASACVRLTAGSLRNRPRPRTLRRCSLCARWQPPGWPAMVSAVGAARGRRAGGSRAGRCGSMRVDAGQCQVVREDGPPPAAALRLLRLDCSQENRPLRRR